MRERTPAMDAAFMPKAVPVTRLDYPFLVKVFVGIGVMLAVVSPLSRILSLSLPAAWCLRWPCG